MSSPRPFRFGIQSFTAGSLDEWQARARHAEDLGYATLTIHDHVGDQWAPMPALAVAAAATTTLRIGTLVLDVDFRHPVFLANEVATLDVLSGGRFEWGMGAGWFPRDYELAGISFDPGPTRVARLHEAVEVMKQCFADGPFDHDGPNFTVRELDGRPKPPQRPHPPLLLGGQGRRMLTYAARHADIVGVAPSFSTHALFGQPPRQTPVEAFEEQLGWIAAAAGGRFDDLEIHLIATPATVTDDAATVVDRMAERTGGAPEDLRASPYVLAGTVDELCDTLVERRERWGLSYVSVAPQAIDTFAPVVARLAHT
jgi:probable F420-dependent oxidoreductase